MQQDLSCYGNEGLKVHEVSDIFLNKEGMKAKNKFKKH